MIAVSFWYWWILAGLLLVAEMLAPGVFFLWVALGSAMAGLVALVAPGLGWEAEGLTLAAVAVASAYLGRRLYAPRRQTGPALNRRAERPIGRQAILEEAIVAGKGRIRLDGLYWTVSGPDLPAGARVRIVAADGAILKVEAA